MSQDSIALVKLIFFTLRLIGGRPFDVALYVCVTPIVVVVQ